MIRRLILILVVAAAGVYTTVWAFRHAKTKERLDVGRQAVQAVDRLYAHQFGDSSGYVLARHDAEVAADAFDRVATTQASHNLGVAVRLHLGYASYCRVLMDKATVESIDRDGKWCIDSGDLFHTVSKRELGEVQLGR